MPDRRPNTRADRGPSVGIEPLPGVYKTRLGGRGSPWVPAVVWWGAPLDPETLEPLDRAHGWQCLIAGEVHHVYERWPLHPIGREEYERLKAAMGDDVRKPVKLAEAKPLF